MKSIFSSFSEATALLLAHNAPVKVKNCDGWNPLMEAVSYGDRQISKCWEFCVLKEYIVSGYFLTVSCHLKWFFRFILWAILDSACHMNVIVHQVNKKNSTYFSHRDAAQAQVPSPRATIEEETTLVAGEKIVRIGWELLVWHDQRYFLQLIRWIAAEWKVTWIVQLHWMNQS